MLNKKGQTTIFILVLILGAFISVIFLGAFGIGLIKANSALDQDIDLGQVNLRELNDDTIGIYTTTYLNNADWWGTSIIFGMVFGLFLSSYFTRNKFPKAGIIFDIFIIVFAFIFALYLSAAYETVLDALASAGETFLEDYTPKSSMFILNLPIFVTIIGVVMMILFHSSIPHRTEERFQKGGILQGVQ